MLREKRQDPSKYTDADKEHMRKVVSYCSRHLAQEDHLKQSKGKKELEESKSTRSLKNWASLLALPDSSLDLELTGPFIGT